MNEHGFLQLFYVGVLKTLNHCIEAEDRRGRVYSHDFFIKVTKIRDRVLGGYIGFHLLFENVWKKTWSTTSEPCQRMQLYFFIEDLFSLHDGRLSCVPATSISSLTSPHEILLTSTPTDEIVDKAVDITIVRVLTTRLDLSHHCSDLRLRSPAFR